MQFHENYSASAKAMHVLHKICHYIALWLFVALGFLVVYHLVLESAALVAAYTNALDAEATLELLTQTVYASPVVSLGVLVFVIAVVHLVASILFRQIRDLLNRRNAKVYVCDGCESKCGCGCEVKSDLDAQVAEVLKWKNLYVEGVITEREFIDKRNEILRIAR